MAALTRTRMAPVTQRSPAVVGRALPQLANVCRARANVRVCASPNIPPIIAFRDAHRAQLLKDTADEFTKLWIRGKLNGTNPEMMKALDGLIDSNTFRAVTMTPTRVKEQKGANGLRIKLETDNANLRFGTYKPIFTACNDDDDVAYALIEVNFVDEQSQNRKGYQIWKLDIMLDDSVRRVTAVTERGMLDPRGLAGPVGQQAASFPLDLITEKELDRPKALDAIQSWCRARSSSESEEAVLRPHLAPDFKLWDVSGSLPGLWASERGNFNVGASDAANAKANVDSCALDKIGTLAFIKSGKDNYDMQTTLVDTAVSTTHNIGFTHWRSSLKGKNGETGKDSKVEGMEIEIYSTEGQLKGIWMFRDVMDFERAMLKSDGDFL